MLLYIIKNDEKENNETKEIKNEHHDSKCNSIFNNSNSYYPDYNGSCLEVGFKLRHI